MRVGEGRTVRLDARSAAKPTVRQPQDLTLPLQQQGCARVPACPWWLIGLDSVCRRQPDWIDCLLAAGRDGLCLVFWRAVVVFRFFFEKNVSIRYRV